jgi:hypothetical protein
VDIAANDGQLTGYYDHSVELTCKRRTFAINTSAAISRADAFNPPPVAAFKVPRWRALWP